MSRPGRDVSAQVAVQEVHDRRDLRSPVPLGGRERPGGVTLTPSYRVLRVLVVLSTHPAAIHCAAVSGSIRSFLVCLE